MRLGRSYGTAVGATVLLATAGCGGAGPSTGHSNRDSRVPASGAASSAKASPSDRSAPRSRTARSAPPDGGPTAANVTLAPPGRESSAQFVSLADAICRGFRARARAIGAGAATLAEQETELRRLVAASARAVGQLTDLSPPGDEEAGLRRFATMTAASVVAFAGAQTRSTSTSEAVGSQVEARDLADSARSSTDAAAATAAARHLGLRVCGSPGSAWL